jgi:Xaa-Pro aminopeptidase
MTLFTDARYREEAERQAHRGIRIEDAEHLATTMTKLRRVGYESDALTMERLLRWKRKFKNTKFIHSAGVIAEFRRSKDPEELRCFRRAQRMTREILRRVPRVLRRPITERELAWQLHVWAHELGADTLAFDPIVAFGTHTSSPHHHPTDRVLKHGHIVQVDVGARYRGYCADQSAVFLTGKPTAFQTKVLQAVSAAKNRAISAVQPGVSTRSLDQIARDVLRRYGFEQYFCHALGHGVGLEIHEGPSLSLRATDMHLLKNEIVTIEPGVYFPGKFGMRMEEEVIVS